MTPGLTLISLRKIGRLNKNKSSSAGGVGGGSSCSSSSSSSSSSGSCLIVYLRVLFLKKSSPGSKFSAFSFSQEALCDNDISYTAQNIVQFGE